MSEQMRVNMEYVRNNPTKPWYKYFLSCNKQLTVKDTETLILPNSKGEWNWHAISNYINIQEVRNNPNTRWNRRSLSMNRQLTVKDIDSLTNVYNEWDWFCISARINIREVINNPNRQWVKEGLKRNKGITDNVLEFFDASLLKHLQKNIYTFKYHTDMIVKCEY